MTIEEALKKRLADSTTLAALVGRRIRPMAFPSIDVRPAILYQVISTEYFETFNGNAEWIVVNFQVDTFADTYADAKAVAAVIKTSLHNYSGTIEDIVIGVSKHVEDTDLTESPDVGQQSVIHRLSGTYKVIYKEG